MASRKEEKERLRQAREEAEASERREERKRLILGYAVAGLITVAVVAGIAVAIAGGGGDEGGGGAAADSDRVSVEFGGLVPRDVQVDERESVEPPGGESVPPLEEAAEAAGCKLNLEQSDEGNTHIAPDSELPDYSANPPTSGDHAPEYLADGAFRSTPSPLNFIHNLEHGRVQIQYQSDLPERAQLELLGLYDEQPPGMVLFPNDDQPNLISAVAWRQTMACDSYEGAATLDAIRAFRDRYLGQGPERIPF